MSDVVERANYYSQTDNIGAPIAVPVRPSDDLPYYRLQDGRKIKTYYDENGYVIVRGLIPANLLDGANAAFDTEVLPSRRFIYRQATANPERHELTQYGFMLNAILNAQSIDPNYFGAFRNAAVRVFSHENLQTAAKTILGVPGKIVQTMYFHGNPSTWPHQDSYYLDSEVIGAMTAVWVATEDIAPGAGRFFIYPKSHLIDVRKNGGDFEIAFHHDRYKKLIVEIIKSQKLECRAPALAKGDAIFWAAKTIHGSLPTTQPERSRRSFTAHFIPQSHRFLQYQSRIKPIAFENINGAEIARPKDLAKMGNRTMFFLEMAFPGLIRTAKRLAIRAMLRRER